MWQILRISPESQPDFVASVNELLHSTARTLLFTLGGLYVLWHLLATVLWPRQLGVDLWLIAALLIPVYLLALRLLRWRLLASQALWLIGLAAAITLAAYRFQRPEITFLYALLPLMAVVVVGWAAGVLVEGLVAALLWWLAHGLLVQPPAPAYSMAVLAGGLVAGLLGWASSRTLATVVRWSLFSSAQAQQHMQAAQEHRAQLAVMLKDLDSAYYRLERANAALVAARKLAEEAERFKAEFVANVSHELRTPLNLIVGFSEVIMTSPESYAGVELPGPYRSDVHAIYRSAQHLLALVDDVLDLARIEAGKITLAREEVDLGALVAEAVDTMREYITAKGLELRVQIAPGLPRLWIDRLRVRQVLLNLLVNAARFTARGWIGVEVTQEAGTITLRVQDSGRGIPPQDVPKVFEEFRSTEQPLSTWHSGTGLGLPISKKFVELHRGQMGVESVFGQGTTFWFTLPAALLPGEPPRSPARRWQPVVGLRTTERIVVVVHDDQRIAALLQRYLDGCRTVYAASLAEGAVLARDLKAIALLTDSPDPLPALPSDIAVVRCRLPSRRQAALALGAHDLLVKPVARHELLEALARVSRPVRRALVVDDDPKIVRLFQRMLRTHPTIQECLEAYGGTEALQVMRVARPDLVVLDLVMPDGDGQGVLEQMAADPCLADIPVIIVSAQGQDYLKMPLPGPISIDQAEGFQLGDLMRLLEALFGALAPGWRQLAPTAGSHNALQPEQFV